MSKSFRPDVDAPEWRGGYTPYDIIKEGTIALVVVAVLTVALALIFSSPDEHAVTIKTWSNATPVDFAQTALSELNGTSGTAQYGAPYNTASDGQKLGPLSLAKWVGVHQPVNTIQDFVIDPLTALPDQSALTQALDAWRGATASTRSGWVDNYTKAATQMTYAHGQIVVPATNAGPVPLFINDLTMMARSGALDQALVTQHGFYTTNYTKPLLFLSDGSYLASLAQKDHLLGTQWGMMNETGSYPGQAWLWLYTFWYQVTPFSTSANADVQVWGVMMLLSVVLLFVPFIPGLRSIPRKTRVYRLIWREHYQNL
ncbi:MAG: hypothetical protein KGJ10_06045 [Acidobacteriota bacterium]|nr:hypothetical protein [Acidobacteriota bacterium]MDE3044373.1 hypothetical protein [Acidobacteriota bacterium]MDE3221843.1 hypothetical protein [Acidobacteriota bacterium]